MVGLPFAHYGAALRSAVTLVHGEWRCDVVPELGGAITRLDLAGEMVLRPAASGAAGPFDLASFPLVPYANRIAHGQVRFGAVAADIPPNLPGEAHPLHGVGYLVPWSVIEKTADSILLEMTHDKGPAWPWSFEARQRVCLDGEGLLCELQLTNTDHTPMPVGLGFHPYFPRAASARLTLKADGVWLIDDQQLPTVHQNGPLRDWSGGGPVQGSALVDHCHTGWTGEAQITWSDCNLTARITASPELQGLHIYAPPGEDFFCLEPVTHRPDAINAPDPETEGLRIVAPGDSLLVWMRIDMVQSG